MVRIRSKHEDNPILGGKRRDSRPLYAFSRYSRPSSSPKPPLPGTYQDEKMGHATPRRPGVRDLCLYFSTANRYLILVRQGSQV